MTVKMSLFEWPRAVAHSWIVALRVNRRRGNAPEAAEQRSRSDTTTEEETHDAFDHQQVRNTRHRDHASVFGELCLMKQWLKSLSGQALVQCVCVLQPLQSSAVTVHDSAADWSLPHLPSSDLLTLKQLQVNYRWTTGVLLLLENQGWWLLWLMLWRTMFWKWAMLEKVSKFLCAHLPSIVGFSDLGAPVEVVVPLPEVALAAQPWVHQTAAEEHFCKVIVKEKNSTSLYLKGSWARKRTLVPVQYRSSHTMWVV